MQQFSCQHRKQNISKQNYEIYVEQEILISWLELQMWSLELVISFLKYMFGIWDWGVANSFWDHVIQISIRPINFSNYEKLKFFVDTFTPFNQILLYFRVTVMYVKLSIMDFYVWYWLGPNLQCVSVSKAVVE
jgi:hypothetical protein